ncbi:REPEAT-CONTAINING PROTEIN putative-RELATED [Salix purpurea]|uniref:REPEAT-CONTAINING PROTEIN putative-RELATED n=1 Tax=Salix purpurea TaxID=77065 RepID=A0A9Q0WH47_SALPP|nr:REPEAT-CONTAINING PROTEIN putative-RELATED [Salix purpurea]
MGNIDKAIELLYMSPKTEIESRTYCSILQLSAELKSLQDGKKVHSFICSSGISIDSVLGSKLVFMYVTCGDLREGRLIFDKIRNEKVFLWNLMMNGYAKIGDFKESVYLFREMLDFGVEVNSHTVSCILKCFAALGSVKEGKWVHGFLLKLGFGSYNAVINSLIAFYLKIRRVDVARKLFDELSDRDVISWNSMISGYVANGFSEKGVELFKKMLYLGVDVDLATMVSILQACANCGDVSLGRAVHGSGVKASLHLKTTFCNTLLDMYAKCGVLDGAIRVFDLMGVANALVDMYVKCGVPVLARLLFDMIPSKDLISWTVMIAGYGMHGFGNNAITTFNEMRQAGQTRGIDTGNSQFYVCAANS